MGSNTTSQGIVISFKGDLAALKSAASQAKTVILGVGNAAKPAAALITSSFKSAASSMQNFSSSAQIAGENTSKLASLQAKAGEAAARLQLAQANAANALKKADDMEKSGTASAEQLAVAQGKAAVAAQQVQTKEAALGAAMQKVTTEEKSMASAMANDARETGTFAEGLDVIKGVLGSIGSGLKSTVSGLIEFGSKALSSGSEASEGMQKATTSVEHFKSESSNMHVSFVAGVKNMASSLLDFTAKIGQAIYGIQNIINISEGLAKALLGPAASAEQTQIAFTGLLGSAEKATSFLKDLRKFAATTPFEFPELAHDAQMMLSFGFQTRDVIPMMTRLGDAISAMGGSSAEIDRATLAIGQMHAKTKVSADEMNQLTELGIPAWDMLAKAMGKTTAQVMDLSSKGLIPADQGIEALMKGMERFKGGMDAQSKSFMGLLSNLKDGATMALQAFGGPILDSAKKGLGDLVNLVSSPAFEKFAGDVGKRIAGVMDSIGKAVSKVKDGFDSFKKSIDKVSANNFAKGISYLAGQFGYLFSTIIGMGKSAFSSLKDDFLKNTSLADLVSGAIGRLGNVFRAAGNMIHKFAQFLVGIDVSPLVDGISRAHDFVTKFIKGIDPLPVNLFLSSIQYLGTQISRTFGIVKGTAIFLMHQLIDMFDIATGQTTKFHKSFDIVNGVLIKTRGPLQTLIGEGFFKLGAVIASAAEDVHKFGTYLQSINWMPFLLGVKTFVGDAGKKASELFKDIGKVIDDKVKPAFEGIKRTLESPTFVTFKNTMGSLFTSVEGLAGSVFNLWTHLSPLGALFSGNTDVGKKFSDVLTTTSGIINTYLIPGIQGLTKWFNDMGPVLKPIEDQLGGMFVGIWNWLQANGPTLMDIGGKIFAAIGDTAREVGPIISKDLLPALSDFGKTVGPMITDFINWEDKTHGVEAGLSFLKNTIKLVVVVVSDIINVVTWAIGVWKWWSDMCTTVGTTLGNLIKTATNFQNGIYTAITKPFADAWGYLTGFFSWIASKIGLTSGQGNTVKANTSNIMTGQHHFAGGVENFKGGMAVVGEKGPEMVRLPRGSDVYTASETRAMMRGMKNYSPSSSNYTKLSSSSGGGSAPVIHNHIYVTVQPTDVHFDIDGHELTNRLAPHQASMIRLNGDVRSR